MMEAQMPTMFFLVAVAVGAGLLAVFVLWLSKNIASEKTRTHGVAIAGITVGVLLLGLLVTRSSHRPMIGIHANAVPPVPPVATSGSGETAQQYPAVAPPSASTGDIHAQALHHHQPPGGVAVKGFALGPLSVAAIVVAVIVLLATSRKGLGAALAGLGIAGAVLLMIFYAASERRTVREVPAARMASMARANMTQEGLEAKATTYVQSENSAGVAESSEEANAEADTPASDTSAKAEADDEPDVSEKPKADRVAIAESPKATEPSKPAPAWIGDEPTVENGVYRAATVSGPYSTRRECETHLDDALRKALREYADSHLRPSAHYAAWADIGYVRNNMIEDRYFEEERYENILGKMYNLHVRLKVEPRDVARFEELARRNEERRAVETASAGGIFAFGALIVLYGGLRFLGRKKRASSADTAPSAPAEASV
jgi:hypothetical protein